MVLKIHYENYSSIPLAVKTLLILQGCKCLGVTSSFILNAAAMPAASPVAIQIAITLYEGIFMSRIYQHTLELLPQIKEMLARGKTHKEIENA